MIDPPTYRRTAIEVAADYDLPIEDDRAARARRLVLQAAADRADYLARRAVQHPQPARSIQLRAEAEAIRQALFAIGAQP